MTKPKYLRRTDEGYRYVRAYRRKPPNGHLYSWALWERQNGRMVRVGTAHTEEDYRKFLRDERKP